MELQKVTPLLTKKERRELARIEEAVAARLERIAREFPPNRFEFTLLCRCKDPAFGDAHLIFTSAADQPGEVEKVHAAIGKMISATRPLQSGKASE